MRKQVQAVEFVVPEDVDNPNAEREDAMAGTKAVEGAVLLWVI